LRAGTENLPGIVSAAAAIEEAHKAMKECTDRLRKLAKRIILKVRNHRPETLVNSDPDKGIPGLVSLSFPGTVADLIVTDLGLAGFAVSAGSACHAHQHIPSRVLMAMGRSREVALGTIRISMGRYTVQNAVDELTTALLNAVERQKTMQNTNRE